MIIPLFFTLLAFLAGASLWIGKRSKSAETTEDFFLMGRKLGLFALVMTLLATQVGGGALMGAAEEAYTRGWIVFCYPLGMVVGMVLLGAGFGAKIRSFNLTTVAEIFEKIYGSNRLRKIASLLSILSLSFILVAQAIAARKFFYSLGFSSDLLFIGFWLILVAYTVMGGLRAVVNTDILQAGFILFTFLIAFIASTFTVGAEPVQAIATSSESAPWLTWLMMPLFFMFIEQDMGQRCFAAKSARTVSLASMIAAALLLAVSLAPIYFGSAAAKQGLIIPEGASVLVYSVQQLTGPAVSTFLVCAILMAIVSTADSLLCSISSNLACDFPSKSNSVLRCRALTLVVGMGALGLSFLFKNVVGMLMFSYELAVSVLFVPVLMAVLIKKPFKQAAIVSMVLGGVTFCLYRGNQFSFVYPLLYSFGGFILTTIRRRIKMGTTHANSSEGRS